MRTDESFVTRSMGPMTPQQSQVYTQQVVDYTNAPVTSKSKILRQDRPAERLVNIGDRMIIKTPKDEYKDVR